jgi:hypothetical protein
MSHLHRTAPDLTIEPAPARTLPVRETTQRPSRLAVFTAAMLRLARSDPRSHEHWRRHRHDHGCTCAQCARWHHVERHGPRGRPGGGGI